MPREATRRVRLEMDLADEGRFRAAMQRSGKEGQAALRSIERAAVPANDNLLRLNRTAQGMQTAFAGATRANAVLTGLGRTVGVLASRFSGLTGVAGGLSALALGAETTDLETSLSRIVGLVGQTEEQVAEYRRAILELSDSGEIVQGPAELGEALFFITSAGAEGAEALDILRQSARAATGGLGETASVADAVTSAVNAYGPTVLSASQATDTLVATVREGKLQADSLAGSLGKILPAAVAAGVEFDEVGASVAALTRIGLSAGEAITGVQGVLSAVNKESEAGAKRLDSVGLSYAELRRQIRDEGLLSALVELRDALKGDSAALTDVLGRTEATNAVLALTGPQVENVRGIFDRLANSVGATDDAAEAFLGTSAAKFQQALAKIKTEGVELGGKVLPVVADNLDAVGVGAAALIGAKLGSVFGIWGTAAGAAAGLIAGLALNLSDAADEAERLADVQQRLTDALTVEADVFKAVVGTVRSEAAAELDAIEARIASVQTQLDQARPDTIGPSPVPPPLVLTQELVGLQADAEVLRDALQDLARREFEAGLAAGFLGEEMDKAGDAAQRLQQESEALAAKAVARAQGVIADLQRQILALDDPRGAAIEAAVARLDGAGTVDPAAVAQVRALAAALHDQAAAHKAVAEAQRQAAQDAKVLEDLERRVLAVRDPRQASIDAAVSRLSERGAADPETVAQVERLAAQIHDMAEAERELQAALRAEADASREAAQARQQLMTEGARLEASLRTAEEERAEAVRRAGELMAQGAITQETYNREVARADAELQRATFGIDDVASAIDGGLDRALRGNIKTWDDLRDVALSTLNDIVQAMVQAAVQASGGGSGGGLASLAAGALGLVGLFGGTGGATTGNFGGLSGTPFISNQFGTFTGLAGRSGGGPVRAGTLYETHGLGGGRRELFMPEVDGEIVTNRDLMAMLAAAGGRGPRIEIIDQRGAGAPAIAVERSRGPGGEEAIRLIVRDEIAEATPGILDQSVQRVQLEAGDRPGFFEGV